MENWKFYMIDTASGASVVDRLWAEHRPQENMPRLRPSNWSQLNWEVVVEVIS